MSIQSVFNPTYVGSDLKMGTQTELKPYEAQKSFGNYLKDAIQSVNSSQVKSDALTQKLVRGDQVELHEVMVAAQKATITLNATMEVRNKIVEAYQEISRMPI